MISVIGNLWPPSFGLNPSDLVVVTVALFVELWANSQKLMSLHALSKVCFWYILSSK